MASIRKRTNNNGSTSYRVEIRLKGFPAQRVTFHRLTDAKKWAQQTEAAIREGRYFKTTQARKHSLSDAIDRYKESVLPTKKDHKKQGAQLEWWRVELGHYTLADVTPSLLVEARDKLGKGFAPATVVRYLAILSHLFTVAVNEWGWLEDSPVRKVKRPKEPRGRIRFLSDEEREALLEACSQLPNPQLYLVVVLALATGMRKSEIMNLTWEDVDLTKGRITLFETKNNEIRVVPLMGKALELLKEHAQVRRIDSPLVFPGKNDPTKPLNLRLQWEAALKTARINDFRFHDLRHSAASYLAMNGASLAEIAEVLGHKTLQMVKRYAHLSEAHTSRVVAAMNQKIFG